MCCVSRPAFRSWVSLTVPVQEKGSVLVPLGEDVVQDLQGETLEVTNELSVQALTGSAQLWRVGVAHLEGSKHSLASSNRSCSPLRVIKPGWTPFQVGHPSAVPTK